MPHRVFHETLNGTPGWVEWVCPGCQTSRHWYEGTPVPDEAIVNAMVMSGDIVLHHVALAFRAGNAEVQHRIKYAFCAEWSEYATDILLTSPSRAQKQPPFHIVGKSTSPGDPAA